MTSPVRTLGHALVVDDLAGNRTIFDKILRSLHFEVQLTCSGSEGLAAVEQRMAAKQPVTIIFLDMMMPEMGGVECAQRIRAAGYKGPIMAFSADISTKTSKDAKGAGVNHYFMKATFNKKLAAALIFNYCGIDTEEAIS